MKILIVEDEVKTAKYLHRGLREQGFTVDVTHNGVDGCYAALEYDYDVIVLDVMLPGTDGFAVLHEIRRHKHVPVIMLTARDSIDDRVRGLRDGADDYLVKPFSFLELVARLEALTRRSRDQSPIVLQVGDLKIDQLSRRAYRDGKRIDLTAKEFGLLVVLAKRQGQIISKTAIAEHVWDMNFDGGTNVVEATIKRLRAKIDAPYQLKLLHTMRGMGYVLEARP